MTIITIRDKNSEEYKHSEDLYNSGKIKENLIDYNTLNNKGFLREINKVLSLNQREEELLKIEPNYVFTTDNFIKILLITLKIRAKVPIIMMGETGCGKTSLIDKLKCYKMRILNIHGGISNKDIIKINI